MKKDIEWLKNEILELSIKARHKENNQREWHMGHEMALFDVNKLIDKLDEPETLSEEWIENHTASAEVISYYSDENVPVVTVEKLKNLLVPKQDKPVIPQFVIDFIESQDDPIYEMCVNYEMWGINGDDKTTRFTEELSEWLDDSVNVKKYYRACIDGYEVEKEKRYRVVLPFTVWDGYASEMKESTMFLALDITSGETRFPHSAANIGYYRTDLTESQIKGIDKRYWAFAEEVTE